MKKYYLLYQTTNLINNKIYIGVHQTNNLDDGYMGSGTALHYAMKKYGQENFLWDILKYCKDEDEMYAEEVRIVNEEFISSKDNYNLMTGGLGGRNVSLETRQKQSISHCNPSQKTREKLRQAILNRSKTLTQYIGDKNRGRKNTPETIKKMQIAKQNMTNEHKENIKIALKNKPIVCCIYCKKTGKGGNFTRHHFDNCKEKPHGLA